MDQPVREEKWKQNAVAEIRRLGQAEIFRLSAQFLLCFFSAWMIERRKFLCIIFGKLPKKRPFLFFRQKISISAIFQKIQEESQRGEKFSAGRKKLGNAPNF